MSKKVLEIKSVITRNEKTLLKKIDFADTFATTNHKNNLEEITNLIFNTTPKWINLLFTLRNKIVGLFGLKTEAPSDYTSDFVIGGYVKFFKIFAISDNQVILGADDSHLNFRVLVENNKSDTYNIKVTSIVEYNNLKGKIYMGVIKPFHRKIVKTMVKNACQESIT